jgi:hypothetical protein
MLIGLLISHFSTNSEAGVGKIAAFVSTVLWYPFPTHFGAKAWLQWRLKSRCESWYNGVYQ